MKVFITAAIFVFGFAFFSLTSCQKDFLVPEPVLIPDTVSFADHIIPMFDESCNMSGCHNTGGIPPDLTLENAYNQLFAYGYIDLDQAEESILYQRMVNQAKPMPPANPLSEAKTQLILSWIEQGALNN